MCISLIKGKTNLELLRKDGVNWRKCQEWQGYPLFSSLLHLLVSLSNQFYLELRNRKSKVCETAGEGVVCRSNNSGYFIFVSREQEEEEQEEEETISVFLNIFACIY